MMGRLDEWIPYTKDIFDKVSIEITAEKEDLQKKKIIKDLRAFLECIDGYIYIQTGEPPQLILGQIELEKMNYFEFEIDEVSISIDIPRKKFIIKPLETILFSGKAPKMNLEIQRKYKAVTGKCTVRKIMKYLHLLVGILKSGEKSKREIIRESELYLLLFKKKKEAIIDEYRKEESRYLKDLKIFKDEYLEFETRRRALIRRFRCGYLLEQLIELEKTAGFSMVFEGIERNNIIGTEVFMSKYPKVMMFPDEI